MKSYLLNNPPSTLYNVIATTGQHTELQSNYGAYRKIISGKRVITNSIGENNGALNFQTNFLIPNSCPGTINNPTGVIIPLSVLEGTLAGFVDESYNPVLGPLVLNLGPLK
jgi:hypothetical protein